MCAVTAHAENTESNTFEATEAPPCDHSWGEWTVTKEASPEGNGERSRTCTLCDEFQTEETVYEAPPCDHSWGEWTVTKEASPEGNGERSRICALCEETQTEEIVYEAAPAAGHVIHGSGILQAGRRPPMSRAGRNTIGAAAVKSFSRKPSALPRSPTWKPGRAREAEAISLRRPTSTVPSGQVTKLATGMHVPAALRPTLPPTPPARRQRKPNASSVPSVAMSLPLQKGWPLQSTIPRTPFSAAI